ncbi:Tight junction-associated protein 1 [Clonorchis sinensis]|uniref:Tight junction-associated protein 1 n=1 Tax=Clonorchis sinensis TaxID=79923 RepID=A0A8T1MS01_CLOSI|nr:Tight junction-associated protein 1 [Clonorchis sinensis]
MELLDLQHENEDLRARLQAATQAIDKKALEFIDLEKKLEEERGRMTCELEKLRERYDRLLSNHHRLSKLNHELEARLLETIDAKNAEKKVLCDELEATKSKLADCERRLSVVSAERNRYKDDCSVAVNLLQTNPDQFLPQNPKLQQVLRGTASRNSDESRANGDCAEPSIVPLFPAFLPTFPPIGLSSMLDLDGSTGPNAPRSHIQGTDTYKIPNSSTPSTNQRPTSAESRCTNFKGTVLTEI